jgi:hypothetical protein
MNTILYIDIDDSNEEKDHILAYNNEKGGIFIWAKNMEDAMQKFKELQPDMIEAVKKWKPEPPKEEQKQESNEERLQRIDAFYNQSKITKIIGRSSFYSYITPGGEAYEEYKDILNAYSNKKDCEFYELFIAFFALGFIWGKRKERQRRKEKLVKNMDAIQYYHYCKAHGLPLDYIADLMENKERK